MVKRPLCDFGVVLALRSELDAFLHQLGTSECLDISLGENRTYYGAEVPSRIGRPYRVIATMLPRMGNLSSALAASDMIHLWRPRHLLVVGIAGGTRPEQQQYGDILVSESILYYEPQKLRPGGAEFRTQSLLPDPLLYDRALNFRNGWIEQIPGDLLSHSALGRAPKVFFGPITSGEKVVSDEQFVSKLRSLQPKAVGIEMERAGVASAALASVFDTGFLSIRSISDFADHKKRDDWQELAAHSAAAWAVSFIKSSPISDEPLEDIPSFRHLSVSRSIPNRLTLFEEIQARIDMEALECSAFS